MIGSIINRERIMKDTTTVWVIEDNERLRGYLKKYINQTKDLKCTGAFSNCESALAVLDSDPAPQILLIDLGLPGMSGIEGIRVFKERAPEIEPLVLTVNDTREKVFEAIQAGASGYMLKSASMDEIVEGCRKVAGGGASLDENIARMMLNAFRKTGAIKPAKKEEEADHNLTDRELEILQLLADGYYVKEIVDMLDISTNTVKFHCKNLYAKLHAQSQRNAISEARRRGIL